jgi:hypothetical protein
MKTLLVIALFLVGMSNLYPQSISNYGGASFTSTLGTYTPISGGTPVNVLLTDDATSTAIDIGFDFYFMGTRYRYVYAGSNGYLSFNPNALNVDPNDQLANNLASCPDDLRPLIAPLWDDIDGNATDATSAARYSITGTAPTRVFTFEWVNFEWDWTSNNAEISFQAKLYETTGKIEFVYSRVGSDPITSPSASIGLAATTSGEFLSLNNVTTPTPSTISEADNLAVKPATGRTFTFEPPAPDGDPTALIFSNVYSTAMTMDWTDNSTNENGFVIYKSTDGTNFSYVDIVPGDQTTYTALSLSAGITYTWRVYGITEGGVSLDAEGTQATGPASLKVPTISPMLWSDAGSWDPPGAPTSEDSVVIEGGMQVILDDFGAICYSIRVGGGTGTAILEFDETNVSQLLVTQDVTIESNGIFRSNLNGTERNHTLIMTGGNLTNNGTLDFSTNSNQAGATITFESATDDQLFTLGSSSTTNFKQSGGVIVSKGTDNTKKVTFTPGGTITVEGANDNGFLQLVNGGFEITGSGTFSNPLFSDAFYTLDPSTALYLDNPNATVAGQNSDLTMSGKIIVIQGTYNIGNTADNSALAGSPFSILEIRGGTVNIAGRLAFTNNSTYIQSGGTLNAPTEGNSTSDAATINSSDAGSTFNVTGGVINIVNSSTGSTQVDFNIDPEFLTYTGGTLKLGNSSTTSGANFNLNGNIPTLTFHTGTTLSATLIDDATINTQLDLTSANSTMILNGQTLTVSGSLTGSGRFTGSAASSLAMTGTGSQASLKFTSGDESLNNLTINRPSSGSVTLGTDLALAGTLSFVAGKLNVGSNELTLNGNVSGADASNNISLNGASEITVSGSGSIGTLYFDQTTPATTNRLTNFTYNRSSQTVTLGNTLQVTGDITPTAGTLATGGNLTLISDASGTANILTGSGSYITGNVAVQRFVTASARRFRFLAASTSDATLQDWKNEIYVTGAGTGNALGQDNSNGFDATTSNQAGVYYYDETNAQPDMDSGWVAQTNSTASLTNVSLPAGKGYRVFVRGDRSSTGRLDGSVSSQNAVTLDLLGTVNTGNISMPVTYTSSGDNNEDGWLLLGNPYPSAYDWNALHDAGRTGSSPDFSGTNYTHLSSIIYIYDAVANSYLSYNAASDAGTLTNGIIPSGAAFLAKASAGSPSLTFTESFKTNAASVTLFKTSAPSNFTIRFSLDSINYDEMIIKYMEEATPVTDGYDIPKFANPEVNIASRTPDNGTLTLNCKPAVTDNADTTFLFAGVKRTGTYTMTFRNAQLFAGGKSLRLVDKLTNTITDLRKERTYTFTCDINNSRTFGNGRFMIVAGDALPNTGIDENVAVTNALYVFPVNTTDYTTIYSKNSTSTTADITLTDAGGRTVGVLTGKQWNNNQLQLDMSAYTQGIYFIHITDAQSGQKNVFRCIKQ